MKPLLKISKNLTVSKLNNLLAIDLNFSSSSLHVDTDVQLQEKLLAPQNQSLQPSEEFITTFADVVVTKHLWPSLAASLSLSETEGGFSQQDHALPMLKRWATSEDATYSRLFDTIKTISLYKCKPNLQILPLLNLMPQQSP